jgi:hypothetical protein
MGGRRAADAARDLHPLCSLAGEWQPDGTGLASYRTEEAPAPVVAGAVQVDQHRPRSGPSESSSRS